MSFNTLIENIIKNTVQQNKKLFEKHRGSDSGRGKCYEYYLTGGL